MATLISSQYGGFDMRAASPAAAEARARGTAAYLEFLGCPRRIAERAAAHEETRRALPNASEEIRYRVAEQKFQIRMDTSLADTTHGNNQPVPSESYLRARVAEIGREIRDAADDEDDDVTCPKCGHTFSPED
jgi:hypothetical protein